VTNVTELLTAEVNKWKQVAEAYKRDKQEGVLLQTQKENDCGLCPKYRKYVTKGEARLLNCRECPIVLATRHTCSYWWLRLGYTKDTDDKTAEELTKMADDTAKFISEVIEVYKWAI